jgi:hypothetical protein
MVFGKRDQKLRWIAFICLFFTALSAVAQCPLCKNALTHSEEGVNLAKDLNKGIFILLVAPFLIIAIIGWRFYRNRKPVTCTSHRGENLIHAQNKDSLPLHKLNEL